MKKPSKTRIVYYEILGEFREGKVEALLQKAVGKGIVTTFDTGRGLICWFEGPPGKPMRELREKVRALIDRGGV